MVTRKPRREKQEHGLSLHIRLSREISASPALASRQTAQIVTCLRTVLPLH
jgi:hypothetical protein